MIINYTICNASVKYCSVKKAWLKHLFSVEILRPRSLACTVQLLSRPFIRKSDMWINQSERYQITGPWKLFLYSYKRKFQWMIWWFPRCPSDRSLRTGWFSTMDRKAVLIYLCTYSTYASHMHTPSPFPPGIWACTCEHIFHIHIPFLPPPRGYQPVFFFVYIVRTAGKCLPPVISAGIYVSYIRMTCIYPLHPWYQPLLMYIRTTCIYPPPPGDICRYLCTFVLHA
jgi:hypothetical protein